MTQHTAVLCCSIAMTMFAASAAEATCDQTCQVIKSVLSDRSTKFAHLKGELKKKEDPDDSDQWSSNLTVSGLQACAIFALDEPKDVNQFNCYLRDVPKQRAQAEWAVLVSAVRAAEPTWKWFRDSDPRYPTAADSISLFAGPARGKYFADIELTDRGGTFLLTLKITSSFHTTGLRLAPYRR